MIEKKLFNRNNKYHKLDNEAPLNNLKEINTNINEKPKKIKITKNFESSKTVDAKTLSSSWFCPSVTRKQSESILKYCPVGSFLVRNSSSKSCSYVLSVKVPCHQIHHHLIIISSSQVQMVGSKKTFSSIFSLVTHLSIMKEILACRLVIEANESSDENEDFIDIDEEPQMEEVILQLKKFLSVL